MEVPEILVTKHASCSLASSTVVALGRCLHRSCRAYGMIDSDRPAFTLELMGAVKVDRPLVILTAGLLLMGGAAPSRGADSMGRVTNQHVVGAAAEEALLARYPGVRIQRDHRTPLLYFYERPMSTGGEPQEAAGVTR